MNSPSQPSNAAATALLATLRLWADQGWLRRLDTALAGLLAELDPQARPALLVSAALLAQMEGRGHTCLPLAPMVKDAQALLDWPPAALPELQQMWSQLPPTLAQWLDALRASSLVRCAESGPGEPPHSNAQTDQGQPLVLAGTGAAPLLYLRRYWLQEQQLAHAVGQRAGQQTPVDEAAARRWLDRLFDPASPGAALTSAHPMDWQKMACAVALRAGLTVITGGPGTGKTYTAARLLALLYAMAPQAQGLRVALTAPTGKAAARLRQSIDSALQELAGRLSGDLAPQAAKERQRAPGQTLDLAAFAQRIGSARTLHALLGARPDTRQFRFNASRPLDVDIVIVDEASMVHLEMMAALVQALPPGAKLILLGDKDQLASVEAGAVLGDLCHGVGAGQYNAATVRYAKALTGYDLTADFWAADPAGAQGAGSGARALAQQTVMLRQSRRFGGQIGKLAIAVNAGDAAATLDLLTKDPSGTLHASPDHQVQAVVHLAVHGRPDAPACYADYLRLVQAGPSSAGHPDRQSAHATWVVAVLRAFDRFRLVCAVHDGDWGTRNLNLAVQQALTDAGLLKARGEWFVGRPAMVTRNDAELGVFNGDVGITLPALDPAAALRVYFLDGDTLRSVASSRLPQVETAFAMTVHKCQGSEFLHTALVLPHADARVLTRELVYTGITRARERFTLLQAQPGALLAAIARPSQRASGLAVQLA
ncbi:MAG: exodeoxyribonuclease V subunit alpha [Rhodoferax sp.]|nr:exodeoxyribonuclease V subunit alpha [Rhodoferax sp.]